MMFVLEIKGGSLGLLSTIWSGFAGGFTLARPRKGWIHAEGKGDAGKRFVRPLEMPSVESPETGTKGAIAAELRGRK